MAITLSLFLLFTLFPSHHIYLTQATIIEDEEHRIGLAHHFKKEKLTHFKIYWHDIVSGPSPTSVTVVYPPKNTTTGFGLTNMIDNPLTEGPDLGSKLVGRAEGLYVSASQKEVGLLMAMNFGFIEGKYKGSSITVMGRNMVFNKVREMPIVGGSGLFRFGRGYVQATTYSFNPNTPDATVQYDCFVMHY